MDFPEEYREPGLFDDGEDPEDSEDLEVETGINKTFVCEDCDFRWQEKIYPDRNDYPDYEDELGGTHACPMCGSANVSFY
jgi:hypothetical protein